MTDQTFTLSRRGILTGAAGLGLVGLAGPGLVVSAAQAAAPKQEAAPAVIGRFRLGEFEITTLLDGAAVSEEPQKTFGMNATPEEFAAVSGANFLPVDRFRNSFTPTLVNTGQELVLFDTGVGEGGRPGRGNLRQALQAAGYSPEQVDIVVLTHMHPDHIGGMVEAGAAAFPNARYVTGQGEFDFWSKQDPASNGVAKLMTTNITPFAEKMTFLGDGGSVVSGITGMAAFGHTPGHMVYRLESGGQQLLITGDMTNHYVWSLAQPDWEVRFDMDKAAAAATRRKVLGMLASDRIPFIGYHMPAPALGFVEAAGNGFRYVPASYQLNL
ncbi:MBL fold metallo-hydrolase [Pannonibacter tanglangensis]|uniref:MBL fold metallo-hydrolase n=1 Tax=Pannonibacter tanglangensis TaxID=2750084 RepID=A0ABW9ZMR2_9HYPH|nr:MBL fold metallo-hydrolase [Pannonibacter sp. XCT-34]NBN65212.1 MBL fold metallo-hydrolase [Pannonibacter sp. XCT-34]